MNWLTQNWFFILFGLLFVGMHLGHGGHGGHGSHGSKPSERSGDEDAGRPVQNAPDTNRPTGHQH